MTVMCRQLTPTSQGVPLEIYAFITDKEWKNYENIVSDIFDHLLASLKTFDLELFELTIKFESLSMKNIIILFLSFTFFINSSSN